MPRNASGNYSLPPVYRATPGTTIRSDQHNTPMEDIAQALTDSIPRNGSAPMTGNLPMGGRRITGLGAPTDAGDAATKAYADASRSTPARTDMGRGVLGRSATGTGPATTITLGDGLEFSGSSIRARLATGLSFVGGVITAAVTRFATQAEAQAGTNNDAAMTPLRVREAIDARAVGIGQTWVDVSGSRNEGTAYRNTTGRPIMVSVVADGFPSEFQVSTNGSNWIRAGRFGEAGNVQMTCTAIIPDTDYYRVTSPAAILSWAELR